MYTHGIYLPHTPHSHGNGIWLLSSWPVDLDAAVANSLAMLGRYDWAQGERIAAILFAEMAVTGGGVPADYGIRFAPADGIAADISEDIETVTVDVENQLVKATDGHTRTFVGHYRIFTKEK